MGNFSKLVGTVFVACGIMLDTDGMNSQQMVSDDATPVASRAFANMDPSNPQQTLNNLAIRAISVTFYKYGATKGPRQLSDLCVEDLIDRFNRVQNRFINELGRENVNVLEGEKLRNAAQAAVMFELLSFQPSNETPSSSRKKTRAHHQDHLPSRNSRNISMH